MSSVRAVPVRRRSTAIAPLGRALVRTALGLAAPFLVAACSGGDGGAPTSVGAATTLALSLTALRPLDAASEGSYEGWILDGTGRAHSAGKFVLPADGRVALAVPQGIARADSVLITVQRPGDASAAPSAQRLLVGAMRGGRADLAITGAVTPPTLPLQPRAGTFTMFTSSNNARDGYPSLEEAGIWLFNMIPGETWQKDTWVRLSQLNAGWTYEGWMVRDFGTASAIWLSYGKFLPDNTGTVNEKDDDGWGPFSGVSDYLTAGIDNFPGSEWLANPLGLPFPKELTLPLDLREKTSTGASRWTHVITIEPAWNKGEATWNARPFLLQPYFDPFGDGGPGRPRQITYHAEVVPRGTAELK